MKNRIAIILVQVAALALPALAQTSPSPLPLPSAVEKELAARASNVTEVTLDKNMLGFASKFMKDKGKGQNDANASQFIQGLDGIYVREYEFDKEGQYSMDMVDQLRKHYETSEWSPMVRERERKTGEVTDVMMKMVNGESRGMFVLEAAPKELTIVLIQGPIRMQDLGKLGGLGGLGALGDVTKDTQGNAPKKNKAQKDGAQ